MFSPNSWEVKPPSQLLSALRKEKYHFVGAYAAVKKCHWLHEALVRNRRCYKSKFYGIQSHRCIQMSPSVVHCTQRCLFCWRVQPEDLDVKWDEVTMIAWDEVEQIVEGCIQAQRQILSGYKAHRSINRQRYEEALRPKHVAISLAGEPALYPKLDELIAEFHRRGMTTFLVTNGTVPNALASLSEEPSQLYVSVCAPEQRIYEQLCRPHVADGWERLNRSLELLPSFKCPTVVRITLVRRWNLRNPDKYAKLISKAEPTYVEPKAYMSVGYARKRLGYEFMPTHEEVKEFAKKLASYLSYRIIDESTDSRVVLLSKLEKPIRIFRGE